LEDQVPEPREGEVLIRVRASGICSGDLFAFKGHRVWFNLPARFGHEPVGEVVKVGPGVTKVRPGDHVVALASEAYSDYLVARQDRVEVIREEISFHTALGEPAACAVNGARVANPRLGDVVVLVGTGFMGLLLVQALRGMARIVALDVDEERLSMARDFGAEVALNPLRDDVGKEVGELTQGEGADIAVESSGNPEALSLAVSCLKRRGRLVIFSYYPRNVEVDMGIWDSKGLEVLMANPNRAEDMRINLRIAAHMINRGQFRMDRLVTHRWKLEEIQSAFSYASEKPKGYLKGVIEP